jgi:very-short-patch-repair endonuclease
VVEVDGSQHQDSEADVVRDAALMQRGFWVLRFWNNQLMRETAAVSEEILRVVEERLSRVGAGS